MSGTLCLRLLGPPQVAYADRAVHDLPFGKALALLGYLAVQDRPLSREHLADLFWPDKPAARGRANLSWLLHQLSTMAPGCLEATPDTVRFQRDPSRRVDLDEFAALAARGDETALAAAVALYRGDLMEGLHLDGCADYEVWLTGEQERWRRQAGRALRELVAHHVEHREHQEALRYAWRLLALEPWQEETHRQVMRLLALDGQRAAALRQYQECARILEQELGLSPSAATRALYEEIRTSPPDREVDHLVPLRPPHNLPAQATRFVGREGELASIRVRLREPSCRLLTLVGPGGSGKTRLALAAATEVLYADPDLCFTHGVYFVSLAPLHSPEAIVPAIAQALGFAFYGGGDPSRQSAGQQLLNYLHQKSMLLILDNAEHLLAEHLLGEHSMTPSQGARRDVAGIVTDILQAAPNVKVLVTSRARLHVRVEHLLLVPGMDVPEAGPTGHSGPAPRDLGGYSAVRLFMEGARRVRPGYQPTEAGLAHIVHICRQVQGMPLGILIAAAWMRTLPPGDIAAQIGQSLDFLEDDMSDVPPRQRSMRATFDHSWRLLTEREGEVFRGVSVFAGGFTHAAAQQVVGATLRELRDLVDHSMIECGPTGRYEVHELLRQYASERLGQALAEKQTTQDRHCAYYAGYLQERETALIGREQAKTLAEIEIEIDNVRVAWDWAVAQGRIEEIDRALGSLAEFYHIRAWFQEGETAFARAAQRLAEERSEDKGEPGTTCRSALVLGKVLARQGWFCDSLGLVEKARELLRESLDILCRLGARREMAYVLSYLGRVFAEEGSPQHEQALDIFRVIGDQRGIAVSLYALGWNLIPQGEYEAARQRLQESFSLYRELGNQKGMADALSASGYVTWVLGEFEAAKRLHRESHALSREIGDQGGMALSLARLARDACGLQEYEEGKHLYGQSLALFQEIGNLAGMAMVLGDLSELATVLGEYAEATQLAHKSLAMDEQLCYPVQKAWASRVLGNAARELDDLKGAREYLRQALQIGMSVRAIAPALLTLVGIAALRMRERQKERALEFLAFVLHHPSTWQWTKDRAAPLMAELQAELSPKLFAAAQERGRARNLEATAHELLAELKEAES